MSQRTAEQAILARERHAMDRWAQGNPLGYLDVQAHDVTWFDDIGAHARIDGLPAIREYLTGLKGKIPPHHYELVEPKVQVYGEVGILTFRYQGQAPDGKALAPWKATSVYRHAGSEWRMVHAHWSLVKG